MIVPITDRGFLRLFRRRTGPDSRAADPTPRRRRWRPVVALLIVAHLLGFGSSVVALMSTRTPQGAIAWIVSLNAIPVVAVPAYWIFGRTKFEGYVIARRDIDSTLATSLSEKMSGLWTHRYVPPDGMPLPGVEQLAKWPFLSGNRLELLIDGDATFESLFAGIAAAQRHILIQFYIVRADALGYRLKERLIEKANEGVQVYFLYDEIGSYQLPASFVQGLEDAGIRVQRFHSNRGSGARTHFNFRNHRKTMVVDGERAWLGGFNVGDEYLGRDEKVGPWRDTHLKIEGPAALALQMVFLEDWHWATDEILDLPWTPLGPSGHDAPVLIVPSGPADRFETASLMMQQVIHLAQQRFWVASPYFIPDEAVLSVLKLAALRGVDVRVLIPERPDNLLAHHAAYALIGPLLDAGVQIYRYQEGFLHGKSFLVDSLGASVGTANLDNRSLRLNFEVTAIAIDARFASDVEQMFIADFARSRLMTRQEIDQQPLWRRVAARAAYLWAPVL